MSGIALSGPMFDPAEDDHRKSVFGKSGGHYNVFAMKGPDEGMVMLRQWFPEGACDEVNLVLFSTSGVHGSYTTIEEVAVGVKRYPDGPPDGDDWPEDYVGDTEHGGGREPVREHRRVVSVEVLGPFADEPRGSHALWGEDRVVAPRFEPERAPRPKLSRFEPVAASVSVVLERRGTRQDGRLVPVTIQNVGDVRPATGSRR